MLKYHLVILVHSHSIVYANHLLQKSEVRFRVILTTEEFGTLCYQRRKMMQKFKNMQ